MFKQPIVITCQPIDSYFFWQNHLYIQSCIERGFKEENIHILLYKPIGRESNPKWNLLKTIYPKLNIFEYEDKGVSHLIGTYIPILRPHILWQHFEKFPELEKETILYTDSDILWTENLDIYKLFDDNVCYISDAKSYMNVSYFESKTKDVLPNMLEEYKKRDVVKELCDIVGIDKSVVIENNNNTGGVQYILKNVNAKFFKKIEEDVISIKLHLQKLNTRYFKNENSGFQSWASDLWAVLYNLWYFEKEVKVVKEMDFSWATDNINKISSTGIFHNAGVTANFHGTTPFFYKGKYHLGQDPTKDPHLDVILNNEESKKHCTWWYANKLKELSNKYKLNY